MMIEGMVNKIIGGVFILALLVGGYFYVNSLLDTIDVLNKGLAIMNVEVDHLEQSNLAISNVTATVMGELDKLGDIKYTSGDYNDTIEMLYKTDR